MRSGLVKASPKWSWSRGETFLVPPCNHVKGGCYEWVDWEEGRQDLRGYRFQKKEEGFGEMKPGGIKPWKGEEFVVLYR